MGRGRRPRPPAGLVEAHIESLNHDGRGFARVDGKACFVHGALPGELVRFRILAAHKNYDDCDLVDLIEPSPERVTPGCAHFGVCGGCSLQHLQPSKQIAHKQHILMDALEHIGKVAPKQILPPLVNESPWGYRRKARLGVKDVRKKGRVLVGFREHASSLLAALNSCEVLHPRVGHQLTAIAQMLESLAARSSIAQIEMAMDDDQAVLIFRNLEPLCTDDLEKISRFCADKNFIPYLQPSSPDSIVPLDEAAMLHYELPDFGLRLDFLPTDFTQVNLDMNRQMLNRAIQLLEPDKEDSVLDLFCGIGNFSLPLATRAGRVVGVEGDLALVERAQANAKRNALDNLEFHAANLYQIPANAPWLNQQFNKVLLDPPRSGALEVLDYLPKLGARQILYVSCYPGTLARDAGELVNRLGYRLESAGVMDMFPHTAHVESIALFTKISKKSLS